MLPATIEALGIVLVAVVPGYIAVTLWARSKTWERPPTDLTLILLAIIFSAVIQVLLFPITIPWLWPVRDHLIDHPVRVALWAVVTLIAIPAGGGIYAGRLSDLFFGVRRSMIPRDRSGWRRELLPPPADLFKPITPSVWDSFLNEHIPHGRILVVTFDNDKILAGSYYQGSIGKTSPQRQGIYLIREWTLNEDGHPVGPIANSRGVLTRL